MFKLGKKSRANRSFSYQLMSSLVVILFLGAMGLSYATWNEMLKIESRIVTGNIEPVFSDPHLSLSEGRGQGQVRVTNKGKTLDVMITNARPGNLYHLDFKVKNKGSIPVKAKELVVTSGDALEIFFKKQINVIEGYGEKEGQIVIKVKSIAVASDYPFMVQLNFWQNTAL